MEQIGEFLGKYLIYIWFALASLLAYFLYIRGKKAMEMFADIDLNTLVYSEKNASGHIVRSMQTRRVGATKMLHVFITDKELILKTYLLFAHIAHENDMLHRIPLENIMDIEYKKSMFFSQLFVKFRTVYGEEKVVVIKSKKNLRIQSILQQYLPQEIK